MSNKKEEKNVKQTEEKATEKQELMSKAKLVATVGKKNADYVKEAGLEMQHTEHNTPKQITAAIEEHQKQAKQVERSQGYHDAAVEKLKKTPEYKQGSIAQHEYDRDSNAIRVQMAQKRMQQAEAVITGQEKMDIEQELTALKIALRETQVTLACKRPDHSGTQKMNLGNFEKERQKAIEAGAVTGKEFPKFAEENESGEWVPAAGRQKQNQPVQNQPKPKAQKEEQPAEEEQEAEEAKA